VYASHMQRIIFLSPGRVKTSWIVSGIEQYVNRLSSAIDLKVIEIPASKQLDPQKHAGEESEALLEKAQKYEGDIWLLDEKGKSMTSVDFAKVVERAKDDGRTLVFILGGAYGLTNAFKRAIDHHIRVSDMTLPHELCQVIFMEQLYRAIEIQKGSGYHH